MANQISAEEKNRVLFMHLVTMFETTAWQNLGKIQNPLTGKIEKDLEQARLSIDILDMLLVKTQGNLSDEERRYLEDRIRNLKLNFVDEVEKERQQKQHEKETVQEEKGKVDQAPSQQTDETTRKETSGGEEEKDAAAQNRNKEGSSEKDEKPSEPTTD